MKKIAVLLVLLLQFTIIVAQDYKITFSGSGVSNEIDSLLVQNLTQGTSLKMSGTDTLLLYKTTTGLTTLLNQENELKVFPNPTQGECCIEFLLNSNENVFVRLFELSGKQLGFWNQNLHSGIHQIQIKSLNPGIYIVQLQTKTYIKTAKIVSNGIGKDFPVLSYRFLGKPAFQQPILKSTTSVYPLPFPYMEGDQFIIEAWTKCDLVLHGRCPSGILPLPIPEESETDNTHIFEFIFYHCVDKCGNSYPTVTIGDQVWMAENLNCETDTGSWVYDGDENNAKTYGRLYTWQEALANAPEGWHLPTVADWEQLKDFISQEYSESLILSLKNNSGWLADNGNSGNGSNSSGFSALPGGARWFYDASFYSLGSAAYFWTATESDSTRAHMKKLTSANKELVEGSSIREYGFSVRYIKNIIPSVTSKPASEITNSKASLNGSIENNGGNQVTECGIYWSKINHNPNADNNVVKTECTIGSYGIIIENLEPNTTYYYRAFAKNNSGEALGEVVSFITNKENNPIAYDSFLDTRDGTVYKTIKIGNQTWMAENLKYLPDVSPPTLGSETAPYYYVYGFNGTIVSDAKATENYTTCGVLYNWPAAMAACPVGWHLPSDDEFAILSTFLGGGGVAGGKLKETGTTHWLSPNTGADNTSGFSALPGGDRDQNGTFLVSNEKHGFWWSSTELTAANEYRYMAMHYNQSSFDRSSIDKLYGLSVRCIKD